MTQGQTTIYFAFKNTTPGTVRYQEVDPTGRVLSVDDGAKIGSLYIRKTALNGEVPQKLRITVEMDS